jgi:mono/diheme cytochrome c family protein
MNPLTRRIAVITLLLLVMLDLGRSAYARLGSAQPTALWQPDPGEAVDIAWPPGQDTPTDAPAGRRLYAAYCAVCHGPEGHGNGPAAPALIPRPRDFTSGIYKYKSTPGDALPTDADLLRTVTVGLTGTAMPGWAGILDESEIREIVGTIKGFYPGFTTANAQPIPIPPPLPSSPESIAQGAALFNSMGCSSCHAPDGRGSLPMRDARDGPVRSRDLTAPWAFRGGDRSEDLWLRLTIGLPGTPMPSFADRTTPEERWHLVNYLHSIARTPPWQPGGQLDGPGQATNPVRRGEYLARAMVCGLCHTTVNENGVYNEQMYLAGGMKVEAWPWGVYFTRNLTSDPATGLGDWTEAEIARAIRAGHTPDGRTLNAFGMPWVFFARLSDEDALAIAAYLKNLPAVHNEVPQPLRYGVIETLILKPFVIPFPRLPNARLAYFAGNYGRTEPGGISRDLPQQVLSALHALVLVVGVVLFLRARATEPAQRHHRLRRILAALLVAILAFVAWIVYEFPAIGFFPPEQVSGPTLAGLAQPDPARLPSAEARALAERGRYLYGIVPCTLCHTNSGAGGGKVNWRVFGTTHTRNLTPDAATGLGAWSEADIERAIRSGVRPDGRPLHWQAMPWDHTSNLVTEDIRALVTYLKALPPQVNDLPPPAPPGPGDCPGDTFFFGPEGECN